MSESIPEGPAGLLLSRDLIFTSKVTGTARMLGHEVRTVGNAASVLALIAQWHPRALFVDLAAGDLVSPESLMAYKSAAGPGATLIAFGSHVDTAGLAAASEAGCDVVLPRSKFTTDLPDLIRRYLGE